MKKTYRLKIVTMAACALLLGMAGFAGPATAAPLTDEQKEEIGNFMHDYIVEHPEIVVEAIQAYQNNQKEMEAKTFKNNFDRRKQELLADKTVIGGNPDGDVTIIEFYDYNCGYCKHAVDDVINLIKQDTGVRFVLKDMPILSPASQDAARWALAAGKQGKYYEYHVALMQYPGGRDASTFKKIATDLELDYDKLKDDAENNKAIQEQVETNLRLARELGINGTPAFIVGDTILPGYVGLDNLKKAVAAQREAMANPDKKAK